MRIQTRDLLALRADSGYLCVEPPSDVEDKELVLDYNAQEASANSIGPSQKWSPGLAASIPSFLSPRCLAEVNGASPKLDDIYDTQSHP